MKTRNLLIGVILAFVLLNGTMSFAQSSGYVKQVITVNSGKFEYAPPYTDYVTVQTYNPQSGNVDPFNTIFTQSAQCIIISNQIAYVAASDSIVKFNLNTLQRLKAVKDSGLCRLALINGRLIVSRQYPVINHFVEVLDTADMGLVAQIDGITGDCGGITMMNDTVYVAVNSGWAGTNGKMAIIDPATWTLKSELDLGTTAVGIMDLYNYNGNIISVNKTPYSVVDTGSISVYHPEDRSFENILLTHTIGNGSGVKGDLLYLVMDYGIGTFNLNALSIQDSVIVPDPGSASFDYITSSVVDTVSDRIYINIGDYITPGRCLVTSLNGDSITSYSTGISAEAVAVDYRSYPAGIQDRNAGITALRLYPNPVSDRLTVAFDKDPGQGKISITDMTGRIVYSMDDLKATGNSISISCNNFIPGMYYIVLEKQGQRIAKTFIKE